MLNLDPGVEGLSLEESPKVSVQRRSGLGRSQDGAGR